MGLGGVWRDAGTTSRMHRQFGVTMIEQGTAGLCRWTWGSGGVVGGLGGGTMLALRSQRIAHQGFGIGSKGNFDAHSFVI